MKLKSFISAVFLSTTFLATAALANVEFQAGGIDQGQTWTISAYGDIASYFKDGTSGHETFVCDLEPTQPGDTHLLSATLTSGKNFGDSHNESLVKGMNGPYTWGLSNQGANDGNIKVWLTQGDSKNQATIRCRTFVR